MEAFQGLWRLHTAVVAQDKTTGERNTHPAQQQLQPQPTYPAHPAGSAPLPCPEQAPTGQIPAVAFNYSFAQQQPWQQYGAPLQPVDCYYYYYNLGANNNLTLDPNAAQYTAPIFPCSLQQHQQHQHQPCQQHIAAAAERATAVERRVTPATTTTVATADEQRVVVDEQGSKKKWSVEPLDKIMQLAVRAVVSKQSTSAQAAADNNIPARTLRRYIRLEKYLRSQEPATVNGVGRLLYPHTTVSQQQVYFSAFSAREKHTKLQPKTGKKKEKSKLHNTGPGNSAESGARPNLMPSKKRRAPTGAASDAGPDTRSGSESSEGCVGFDTGSSDDCTVSPICEFVAAASKRLRQQQYVSAYEINRLAAVRRYVNGKWRCKNQRWNEVDAAGGQISMGYAKRSTMAKWRHEHGWRKKDRAEQKRQGGARGRER